MASKRDKIRFCLDDFLETLPHANHHCAELAVGALYKALNTVKPGKKEDKI